MAVTSLLQGSPDWEAARKTKVTATDIATLMCGTPQEVYDLYHEKVNGKRRFKTEAMAVGTAMEPEAIEWFFGARKKITRPVYVRDFFLASLDAYHVPTKTLLEVKCPTIVPDKCEDYPRFKRAWWQVQAQLYCAGELGLEHAILLLYSPLRQKTTTIMKDEGAFEEIKRVGAEFYERLVTRKEPEAPKSDLIEREDAEASFAVDECVWAKERLKEAEAAYEAAKKKAIEVADGMPFRCNGVSVELVEREGGIDYRSIPQLKEIDLEQFKRPSVTYWRVS